MEEYKSEKQKWNELKEQNSELLKQNKELIECLKMLRSCVKSLGANEDWIEVITANELLEKHKYNLELSQSAQKIIL